jgi:multidrug resistance efflux pump
MNDKPEKQSSAQSQDGDTPEDQISAESGEDSAAAPGEDTPKPRDPVARWTRNLLIVAALLFLWYISADRVAPWTDQARVDGFIVAITPKVSGKVKKVNVVQDQVVEAGDVLAKIDPRPYELTVQRAEARLEIAGQETGADTATVAAAEASLAAARARRLKAEQDHERIERIFEQDPGATSKAARDNARATKEAALAQEANAQAELEKAKELLGRGGEDAPIIRDAVAALEQARIDLAETTLYAPSNGGITNLEVEVGHYAKKGVPLMTFVAFSRTWIEAYLRENSLANIELGDPVEVALDLAPGQVFKGKVVSKGYAVAKPTSGFAGGLVEVKGDSGWLRDAQRFPVVIHFDDERVVGYRYIGGQADVQIYTKKSNFLLNALGWFWIRFMSFMSYVY